MRTLTDGELDIIREQEKDARPSAGNYYGNSTLGFDTDEPAPTALLRCPACHGEIEFYGEIEMHISDLLTLEECDRCVCTCGAIYGDGDTLAIIDEDGTPKGNICETCGDVSLTLICPACEEYDF